MKNSVSTKMYRPLYESDPQIAAAIESDPVFAGRVLQHANSAEFGFTSPVDEVHRALVLLGAHRVREIAATVAAGAPQRRYRHDPMSSRRSERRGHRSTATDVVAGAVAGSIRRTCQ